jgi:hypothetical protein
VAVRDVGVEFVAAAAQVLDERMPGGEDPRGPVAFESASMTWPYWSTARYK